MTLSCKIAPTPHLIKYPQSNCVGINGVAMLILLNNSAYRFIACHKLFLVQIPLSLRRRYLSLTGKGCFGGCGRGSASMKMGLLCLYSWQGLIVLAYIHIHLPLWWLESSATGKTRVKVSLMDLRLECMWFLHPEWMCVPSSGLAG